MTIASQKGSTLPKREERNVNRNFSKIEAFLSDTFWHP
jgi:hypothetical protein